MTGVESTIKTSVAIPVYRSETTLDRLIARLTTTLDGIGDPYEIVLVNDGSPDGSWERLIALQKTHPRLHAINLMRNFGQHSALMCAFAHCRGEIIVTLDDDLQHYPEDIPNLLRALEDASVDVAMGRYQHKRHSRVRNWGTWLIKQISATTLDVPKDLDLTSFRAMRKPIVDALLDFRVASPRIGLMVFAVTRAIVNVPVRHAARATGRSGYSWTRLIANFLDNILYFSSLPLRLVSYGGLTLSMISLLLGVWYLFRYFSGGITVSGFATIVLLTTLYAGVVLGSLGIVGEYLVRIVRASEQRPLYVIREQRNARP